MRPPRMMVSKRWVLVKSVEEVAMGSPDDTGNFDMGTYAFVVEKMQELRLPCFWKVTPLKEGAMLNMTRPGENERIYIQSSVAMRQWIQVIVDWATGKGFGLDT